MLHSSPVLTLVPIACNPLDSSHPPNSLNVPVSMHSNRSSSTNPHSGTPGDVYEPQEGVNIEALIEGGLVSTDKVKKSSKVKSDPVEE